MVPASSPVRAPIHIRALLDRLHALSSAQESALPSTFYASITDQFKTNRDEAIEALDKEMLDKFIALERDKSEFIYQLIVSSKAHNIVEAGTSFGVSTIYLALAVAEVEKLTGVKGKVIGTEKEADKAKVARAHWKECGEIVESRVDLRVGDLLQTLAKDVETVDFLLLDIWSYLAFPTVKVLLPKLKPGAIIVADNTISAAEGYTDLLTVLRDPEGDFRTSTLPFSGGVELSIYAPRAGSQ